MSEIIYILIAIIICAIIPMYVKSRFVEKYNVNILMLGPIIINCIALLSILAMNLSGKDISTAIGFTFIAYLFTSVYVATKTKTICSKKFDILLSVVANALIPIGIALIILMALVLIYAASTTGHKKRRGK